MPVIRYLRPRTVPLSGTEEFRQAACLAGAIDPNELHTTSDQHRLWLECYLVGQVYHGDISSDSEMVGLNASSERGVWPNDYCWRTDHDTFFICISNNGENVSDWRPTGSSVQNIHVIDGGDADGEELVGEDEIDGGDAADSGNGGTDVLDDSPNEPEV